jgi:hypothetical protein
MSTVPPFGSVHAKLSCSGVFAGVVATPSAQLGRPAVTRRLIVVCAEVSPVSLFRTV